MPEPKHKAPALILGAGVNGLGVLRSLARCGAPVVVADSDPHQPGMRSRYGRKLVLRASSGERLVDDLVAFARKRGIRPFLFLTEEAGVRTVSAARERLAEHYELDLAAAPLLDALMDKASFQQLAEQHGFLVPRSLVIGGRNTLLEAESFPYPAILKPARKDADYARAFDKAYRVESFDELRTLCARIRPVMPDLILQQWIDGGDADIYFCLQYINVDGTAVASFTGRKIRSWPPQVGGTASCTAAPEHATALGAETGRFFATVGYTGMGSIEFKRNPGDERFYMIEPTVARTDYQEEVATLNGINIPLAAYCKRAGLAQPQPGEAPHYVVWRESATDRWSAQAQRQPRRRCGRTVDALWRWYDPAPGLAQLARRVRRASRRRLVWRRQARPAEGGL